LIAEGVTSRLAWVDLETGERRDVLVSGVEERWLVDSPALSADGRTLAAVRSGPAEPPEVWAGPVEGPLRRLSDHGRHFGGVAWGRQAVVGWRAPDGWAIDGLLLTPPGYRGGRLPLVCYVHGGPYGRFADGFNVTWGQW